MGMVLTQHITHAGSGFLEGFVGGQAAFVHGVENPAVYRLQAVPHIGQGPAYNDAHGVLNVGLLHFVYQLGLGNHLVGEGDVLRFVITVVCHIPHLLKYRCSWRNGRGFQSIPSGAPPARP